MEFEDDIEALYATYQSLLPMAEADSARLWQKFRLDWNYNSNRIEGNTLTRGETKALLEDGIKPIKMRKDILQMQSHDKAIDVLRDLAKSERPLTEADIRALHKTALGENYWTEAITIDDTITRREIEIGTYKQKPNMVRKQDGTEHIYAQPNEVPARMAKTMTRLRQYLKKADVPLHDYLAELHQDFIETHPFDDGNGRVVRLLVNYVCLHLNWPPVIIKSDKRSEYIASLESWNGGDERPFRELMKRELTWSLKKSIAAARGEDIEDDGDLEKEITNFVNEASHKVFVNEKREKDFEQQFRSLYWRSLNSILDTANNFHKVFEKISTDPPIARVLGKTLQVKNLNSSTKLFNQWILLENFKPLNRNINFTLILSGVKDEVGTSLKCRLKSNCSMTPESLQVCDPEDKLFSKTIELKISEGKKFIVSESDIDKFSKNVAKLLFEKLKLISP